MGMNVQWHMYDNNVLRFHKANTGKKMALTIITEEGEVTFFLPSKAMADTIGREFSELFDAEEIEFVPDEDEYRPSEVAMAEVEAEEADEQWRRIRDNAPHTVDS